MIESFEQHMLDRQEANKDSLLATIKHFYSSKIITEPEYRELLAIKFPEKIAIDTCAIIYSKMIALSIQSRSAQNQEEKLSCLNQQIVLSSALNLLSVSIAKDNSIALKHLKTISTIK